MNVVTKGDGPAAGAVTLLGGGPLRARIVAFEDGRLGVGGRGADRRGVEAARAAVGLGRVERDVALGALGAEARGTEGGHGRGTELVTRLRGKADVRMTTDEILALTRKRA